MIPLNNRNYDDVPNLPQILPAPAGFVCLWDDSDSDDEEGYISAPPVGLLVVEMNEGFILEPIQSGVDQANEITLARDLPGYIGMVIERDSEEFFERWLKSKKEAE